MLADFASASSKGIAEQNIMQMVNRHYCSYAHVLWCHQTRLSLLDNRLCSKVISCHYPKQAISRFCCAHKNGRSAVSSKWKALCQMKPHAPFWRLEIFCG